MLDSLPTPQSKRLCTFSADSKWMESENHSEFGLNASIINFPPIQRFVHVVLWRLISIPSFLSRRFSQHKPRSHKLNSKPLQLQNKTHINSSILYRVIMKVPQGFTLLFQLTLVLLLSLTTHACLLFTGTLDHSSRPRLRARLIDNGVQICSISRKTNFGPKVRHVPASAPAGSLLFLSPLLSETSLTTISVKIQLHPGLLRLDRPRRLRHLFGEDRQTLRPPSILKHRKKRMDVLEDRLW